jgi:hypothetical protein
MQMAERGIRRRLSKRYRINGVNLNCLARDKSLRDPIGIQQVIGSFAILMLGIAASTLILGIEVLKTCKARIYFN